MDVQKRWISRVLIGMVFIVGFGTSAVWAHGDEDHSKKAEKHDEKPEKSEHGEEAERHEEKSHKAEGESHGHAAPHGGVVKTIGKNHVELVFTSKKGRIEVYILGGKESEASPLEISDLTAYFKIGDGKFQKLVLAADPLKGEKKDAASRFSGTSADLKGAHEINVSLNVPIKGKKYRAKFSIKAEK